MSAMSVGVGGGRGWYVCWRVTNRSLPLHEGSLCNTYCLCHLWWFLTVFKTFDEMVRAVKSKQVGGLLVDRFTGYYYMAERNYTGLSLITSQHIEKMAKVGLVFAQGREDLIACLNLVKVTAIKSVESITSKYKVGQAFFKQLFQLLLFQNRPKQTHP